jgi:hypothetical protein
MSGLNHSTPSFLPPPAFTQEHHDGAKTSLAKAARETALDKTVQEALAGTEHWSKGCNLDDRDKDARMEEDNELKEEDDEDNGLDDEDLMLSENDEEDANMQTDKHGQPSQSRYQRDLQSSQGKKSKKWILCRLGFRWPLLGCEPRFQQT